MPPTNSLPDPKKHVLSIGAAGLDIVGRIQAPPEPGASTPAEVRPSFGGVARNIAENLARLGQRTSLLTVTGNDQIGQQLLQHTAACGVDTHACLKSEQYGTASYLAVLGNDGYLLFALDDMRVLNTLKPEHIRKSVRLFAEAGLIFMDANLPPATLRAVVQLAHKLNIAVCADPASPTLAARLLPHLDQLYMVTANSGEAAMLCESDCGSNDPQEALQLARSLVARGVEIAVVTLAEYGVCYATSETNGHVPAISTQVLDPTGAGNAMTAAIIFGMMNNMPIDEAVRLGVSAASLTLRYPGAVFADLTLEKLYDQLVI